MYHLEAKSNPCLKIMSFDHFWEETPKVMHLRNVTLGRVLVDIKSDKSIPRYKYLGHLIDPTYVFVEDQKLSRDNV